MRITSGRHKGKTLELVALKDPEFIGDLLAAKFRSEAQKLLQAEARRLVEVFDRRAFLWRCAGRDCGRMATLCSIYKSDVFNPMWWCDACDPWQFGARREALHVIRTYRDALNFCTALGDPTAMRDLVRALAEAKGLAGPKVAHADAFFNG